MFKPGRQNYPHSWLGIQGVFTLACVAWQFKQFLSNLSMSAQSSEAVKTSSSVVSLPGSLWLVIVASRFLSVLKLLKNRQAT